VNNVAPDYTPTPNMTKIGGGDGGMSTQAGLRVAIPMGRAGLAADVSGCVVFLASELAAGCCPGCPIYR
jgi:3-oxoacyl-[acyl-carrier protein] reductase